ncbi:MarR family transcriptional regulator [Yinghuangia sp. ASG 101]|nr:MarR family transcriptional regulator [Yinghuangia sp. ASG 101]UGQ15653.1 MarR family transcriptional regulator [Yinghuangia sp. ASG 101]
MDRLAADAGLVATDVVILGTLRRADPPRESSPAGLARRSLLSPPGMAKRLAHLESLGLVHRSRRGGSDRRGVVVRLTRAGDRLLGDIARRAAGEHHAVLALPEPDASHLAAFLRQLLHRIEAASGHGRPPAPDVVHGAVEQVR